LLADASNWRVGSCFPEGYPRLHGRPAMKITICSVGSRGDVQPPVALAKGLIQAGHEVTLSTHARFSSLAEAHGVPVLPMEGDPREILLMDAVQEIGSNPVKLTRWFADTFKPRLKSLFLSTMEAVEGSDLVLVSTLSFAAFHVAEKLGVPALSIQLQPSTSTRAFPGVSIPPPAPWFPFKGTYNLLATRAANRILFRMLRPITNEVRRESLGLPPLPARYYHRLDSARSEVTTLYGFSPTVVPKPSDWGTMQHVTGYWFLDRPEDHRAPQALEAFLASGPPPVYVGFGSMVDHQREDFSRTVIEAIQRSGERAILYSGWSDLGLHDIPDSVFVTDEAPHDWLFPRVAAVVHHGGAGTTASGLRAGLPTVVVPFFGDQFFWAWCVHRLGAGPKWIPRRNMTAETLASAIRAAVLDGPIRERAAALGRAIRKEDGVGTAITLVERFAAAHGAPDRRA